MVFLILGTILVQVPNVWAIKELGPGDGFTKALLIATKTLPFTFLATACYAYFYSVGGGVFSYPVIAISAYGSSLIIAFLMQHLFLKDKYISVVDLFALGLVVIGLLVMIFKAQIENSLSL